MGEHKIGEFLNHPMKGLFKEGDIFVTKNPMFLGRIINWFSGLRSTDGLSEYSHAGLFLSSETILESSWTVDCTNFLLAYEGKKVLVGRHTKMDYSHFSNGIDKINKHIHQLYPFPRLFLHLLGLARFIHWKYVVCSELVAKFLYGAELRHGNFFGTIPDTLADEIKHTLNIERTGPQYIIVYEGVLPVNIFKSCMNCNTTSLCPTDSNVCPECYNANSMNAHGVTKEQKKYNAEKLQKHNILQ